MRLSSFRVVTATSCLLFGAAAWRLGPHSASDFAAHAQTATESATRAQAASQKPQLQPVSAKTTKAKIIPEPRLELTAAPGTELYTAKRGEAIPTIAHHYLGKTSYLTSSELADAIRAANHKSDASNFLKANEQIIIPGILPAPIVEHTIPVAKDFEVRAVYLTGLMAASDHGIRIIKHWREVGGNAVVFDIKDSDGSVNIPFEHPLLGDHKVYIHDLPKFVHFLHQQNMHAIARIAIFRDEHLVVTHPELAVQSRKNHTAWRENGKLVWTDPSNPKVQDYDIALAKHVAQLGVDEIQFDYVRFPAEGDQKDAQFAFQTGQQSAQAADAGSDSGLCGDGRLARPAKAKPSGTAAKPTPKSADSKQPACQVPRGPQRSDVITAFLKKAYAELHPTGVLLSLDVFGVMAWQRQVDLSHTGQDIVGMAKYCDVLSPMIYPSHFFGMDNIPHPGDEPAHFIGESMDRFELITKGSGVVIRPWLQAFHWRTKTYSPEYIKIQVETARAKGGIGFLFWNAANDYSKPYEAMPQMKADNYKDAANTNKDGSKANPRYFRGDEMPATTVQAALTPAVAPAESH
ncbi:MAG TPA: putative glycoside hydrolase [Terriglobales bacterium]|nr:putative glycoside hydrolase [Terriglobales bacterium]